MTLIAGLWWGRMRYGRWRMLLVMAVMAGYTMYHHLGTTSSTMVQSQISLHDFIMNIENEHLQRTLQHTHLEINMSSPHYQCKDVPSSLDSLCFQQDGLARLELKRYLDDGRSLLKYFQSCCIGRNVGLEMVTKLGPVYSTAPFFSNISLYHVTYYWPCWNKHFTLESSNSGRHHASKVELGLLDSA